MMVKKYNYVNEFITELQSEGRYSFSLEELRQRFRFSKEAIKLALKRLSQKGKIVSVRKGFYVIVPPEYAAQKILPPALFINQLMSFINKPYYVGLLSAAALFGAGHQQPQEYQVVTRVPALRNISVKGIKIIYFNKRKLPEIGIEEKKTDTGYVKISSPELTATDLIQFENKIGGFNRVYTVLQELIEQFENDRLKKLLDESQIQISSWQRLGYIIENYLQDSDKADLIYSKLKEQEYFRIPMSPENETNNLSANDRWRVIENINIESDL
jgi:predicted transcriptional regulator of viral defense system